jgi:hypothetical protein
MVELPAATQVRMCCSRGLCVSKRQSAGHKTLCRKAADIFRIKNTFHTLRLQFLFVCLVPRYLNFLRLTKNLLPFPFLIL